MVTGQVYTRAGYVYTLQIISEDVSHLFVRDTNLYPDSDSRSTENREWLFPINDIDDIKKLKKLFSGWKNI